MPDTMLGPYRLMEPLGSGPHEDLYLAWDSRLNQRVRLSVLTRLGHGAARDPELHSAFQNVMRRLVRLRHRSLLTPFRYAQRPDEPAWFVTDPPDGISLAALIRGLGHLHWRQTAMVLHEVSTALAFAHTRGVAHGALSPHTLHVASSGQVALSGFDVMARIFLEVTQGRATDLASLYGTPEYLSPECLHRRVPSLTSDIYSLGLIAHTCLTGRHPFGGVAGILAQAQARRDPPTVGKQGDTMPPSLAKLVGRTLAVRPDARPSDATVVAEQLSLTLRDVGVLHVRASLQAELQRQRALVAGPAAEQPRVPGAGSNAIEDTLQGPPSAATIEAVTRPVAPKPSGPTSLDADALMARLEAAHARRPRAAERTPARAALIMIVALVVMVAGLWLWSQAKRTREVTNVLHPTAAPGVAGEEEVSQAAPSPLPTGKTGKRAPASETDPAAVARRKVEVLLASGNLALGEIIAREGLVSSRGRDAILQMLLGRILQRQGKVDAAVQSFLAADEAEHGRREGHLAAAALLGGLGRCREAAPLFEAARRRGEDSAAFHARMGSCQLLTGAVQAAVRSFERAHLQTPEDVDILTSLGSTLQVLGRVQEARTYYDKVLAMDPDNRAARLAVARLTVLAADPAKAAAWLRENSSRPGMDDPAALAVEAHAAMTAGQHARAAALYGQLIKLGAGKAEPDLLRNHAVALDAAGKSAEAMSALRTALAARPSDLELRYLLGRRLAADGRHREAAEHLRQATTSPRAGPQARFDLGVSQMALGDHRDAARTFAELVDDDPDDERALENLAAAQVQAGMTDKAVASYGRLATQRPTDATPLLTMAALLQRMDRRDEAAGVLAEACRRGAKEACLP